MKHRPKLIFLVAEDWYFVSHRLPLAVAAREAGFDVAVITRVGEHGEAIVEAGIQLLPMVFERRSGNLFLQLRMLWKIYRIYAVERPDIVHHVALKPVVFGTMAARLARVPSIVNAVAGLGWLFSASSISARSSAALLRRILAPMLNRGVVIVQNPDDLEFLSAMGVRRRALCLIRGAGVNTELFNVRPEPAGEAVVMLASRMLRNKGAPEFVEAARRLRKEGIKARFVLVGGPDPANPASIPEQTLRAWSAEDGIEWWGRRDDMAEVIGQCHIFCLPSYYGEGIPKVIIEAASCGRAIVTTDMPGCREAVRDGDSGILVPAQDVAALMAAIRTLLEQPDMRRRMGERARVRAVEEFSEDKIIAQTISIYRSFA